MFYILDKCILCFKLYEPNAELVLSKVYLEQNNIDKAKEFANSAHQKATQMSYHWPKIEAEELLKKIELIKI